VIPEWLISILASAGVSAAFTVALVWLSKTWISERLKGAIQHEYDQKLEALKAQLKAQNDVAVEQLKTSNAQLLSVHASASSTYSQIHSIGHERRLRAIEVAWKAVVHIRHTTPNIVMVGDLVDESQYSQFMTNPTLQHMMTEVSLERLVEMSREHTKDVEEWRPFMGEYIYSMFEAYRTLTGRVAVEIRLGFDKGTVQPWFKNPSIRTLVENVLETDQIAMMDASAAKLNYVRSLMENKVLGEAARLISGEASSTHALEQAARISEAIRRLNESAPRAPVTK